MRDTLLVRIEDAEGLGQSFGSDLDAPVGHRIDIDVLADKSARQIVHLKPDTLAVIFQREFLGDITFVARAEHLGEAVRLDVQMPLLQPNRNVTGLAKQKCHHRARR